MNSPKATSVLLPKDIRDQLESSAAANFRTLTGEIIARLTDSLGEKPSPRLEDKQRTGRLRK
jgi:hypothetical protein